MSVLNPENLILRPIQSSDNTSLEKLVKSVLAEFGCVGPGYASSDPELGDLHAAYQPENFENPDRAYWVIADAQTGQVYGGGGFARLKGTTRAEGICELQKFYFDSSLRGLGFGRKILEKCIEEAEAVGFQIMYLETVDRMAGAVSLYEKLGFTALSHPLGNTGHNSCTVFMCRPLGQIIAG